MSTVTIGSASSASDSRQSWTVTVGPLTIQPFTREVRVDGEPVELARKEFDLLLYLAAEPTRVFTKRELLRDVWGYKMDSRTRTLDSHAGKLRKKLADRGHQFVINVWGVGYRLSPVIHVGPHLASPPDAPSTIRCPHCRGRL